MTGYFTSERVSVILTVVVIETSAGQYCVSDTQKITLLSQLPPFLETFELCVKRNVMFSRAADLGEGLSSTQSGLPLGLPSLPEDLGVALAVQFNSRPRHSGHCKVWGSQWSYLLTHRG